VLINADGFEDGETRSISFSENISIPESYNANGDAVVSIVGDISKNKDKFRLIADVSVALSVNCDLCLEPFQLAFEFEIDEFFSNSEKKEEDCWHFSGKFIDIKLAVVSAVLLNMPMKAVCSENCKGLCGKCGHNLNYGECGCDRTYSNPKFEKLKALFEEE